MLRFCRNIAGVIRSSVKHTPTLLPNRIEECRLSLKQILNGKGRVLICVKSVTVLPKRKATTITFFMYQNAPESLVWTFLFWFSSSTVLEYRKRTNFLMRMREKGSPNRNSAMPWAPSIIIFRWPQFAFALQYIRRLRKRLRSFGCKIFQVIESSFSKQSFVLGQ